MTETTELGTIGDRLTAEQLAELMGRVTSEASAMPRPKPDVQIQLTIPAGLWQVIRRQAGDRNVRTDELIRAWIEDQVPEWRPDD